MGYSNNFSLRVEGQVLERVKSCSCGLIYKDLSLRFCGQCGAALLETTQAIKPDGVIKKLLRAWPHGDVSFLLDETGDCSETGSGYNIQAEITEFSKRYPDLVWILACQWESSMVGAGEPGTDYVFIKNGVAKKAEAQLSYIHPFTGKPFNPVK